MRVQLEACVHPFFDELRDPNCRLPNGRPLPPLFNFKPQGELWFVMVVVQGGWCGVTVWWCGVLRWCVCVWGACRVEGRDTRYPTAIDTRARKEAEPDAGAVSEERSGPGGEALLVVSKVSRSCEDWSAFVEGHEGPCLVSV